MKVPLCDPALDGELALAILADIGQLLGSGQYIGGNWVDAFEKAWAAYCGREFCVGTSSGTDALRIALLASGARGSRVIVPAMTFTATYEAVVQAGYVPLPVDVLPSGTIDPELVEKALVREPDVAAVIPVHLYGQLADVERLEQIADRHGVAIIHDACQAHGVRLRQGIDAWSFYPTKNLGAIGDAGAITTDDPRVARIARSLSQHGQSAPYLHQRVGYTARLDAVQAVALLHKLWFLDQANSARARAAARYRDELRDVDELRLPILARGVWHLYVVRADDPAGLAGHLTRSGIETGRHYPVPPPLATAFTSLGCQIGDFPQAEALGRECLSLPFWPEISEREQAHVSASIREWFS